MIFTPNEIQRLFGIIDFRLAKIIADVLGVNQLTPEDKILLERNNVEWRKELGKISPYYQSYLFGKLSGVLSPSQLQSIDYNDFSQYIERKQFKTLSNTEKAMFNAAATRSYAYIKSMGSRMKDIINNAVSQEEIKLLTEQQRILEHTTIKREMIEGVLKKKSIQSIVSDIGHSLEDWNRDWGRIVETEMQGIYQIGVAQQIMENHGTEAFVYKEVYPQACSYCIHAYTTQGIGSKPRIFKLIDLIANGDNIGLKRKDWKPVLGPQHPFCRCNLRYIPKGYIWDDELKIFIPPKDYKRKIQRESKVRIYVGDKEFVV